MKKYEMTSNVKEFLGHKLFQIKALKDFGDVKAGDLGGYIEKEENLSQDGRALICDSADYICFQGFGSKSRNTTIFRTRNENIMVKCGCFKGNLKEFSEKIKETHGNTKYAKEYLACIEVAKIHFGIDK